MNQATQALVIAAAKKAGKAAFIHEAQEANMPEETINEIIAQAFATNAEEQAEQVTVGHSAQTRPMYHTELLESAFAFEGRLVGQRYLKAKDRAIAARAADQAELVEAARAARRAWVAIVPYMPEVVTYDEIAKEHCGLGRDWVANGKMVKQFADANGCDQQTAADLVSRSLTVAQDYVQAKRGLKFDSYCAWLDDAAQEAGDEQPANLEEIVLGAYKQAAKWNRPADGLLIREFAKDLGISDALPEWVDMLKANMPTEQEALIARRRMSDRADRAAQAEKEAEAEVLARYGTF